MCAIIDNNVRHEVFGDADVRTEAGNFFFEWVNSGKGKLVVGGELLQELSEYGNFRIWLTQALLSSRAILITEDDKVGDETALLQSQGICKSNDAHVLALARVSGARLLFTNDRDLQADFGNRAIIGGARGRIYTTLLRKDVRPAHRNLLNRTDLCNL